MSFLPVRFFQPSFGAGGPRHLFFQFVHPNGFHPLHRKRGWVSYTGFQAESEPCRKPSAGGILPRVTTPDLKALRLGDADAWDEAFRWLWPTAFQAARFKLEQFLPEEVEDAAIEALEELVEKVNVVGQVEELKPLVASVAHNRAVSKLRERFAQKRGAGRTESLEALQNSDRQTLEPVADDPAMSKLSATELASLLSQLAEKLKPEQRIVLSDFFLEELSYHQIAKKRAMPIGSVGVYLKRGLEALSKCAAKHPKLLKELTAFLRCLL